MRCRSSGPSHHGQTVNSVSPIEDIVAVAGDAELAHLADPARVFLALGVALVEIVIAGAEDDPGLHR